MYCQCFTDRRTEINFIFLLVVLRSENKKSHSTQLREIYWHFTRLKSDWKYWFFIAYGFFYFLAFYAIWPKNFLSRRFLFGYNFLHYSLFLFSSFHPIPNPLLSLFNAFYLRLDFEHCCCCCSNNIFFSSSFSFVFYIMDWVSQQNEHTKNTVETMGITYRMEKNIAAKAKISIFLSLEGSKFIQQIATNTTNSATRPFRFSSQMAKNTWICICEMFT